MRKADHGHRPAQFLETCSVVLSAEGVAGCSSVMGSRAMKRSGQSIAGLVGPLVRRAYSRALPDPTAPSIRHV